MHLGHNPAMDESRSWARWLSARMVEVGLPTNSDLARASGIPQSVISRWRTSGSVPLPRQLRLLSTPLRTPMLQLMIEAGYLSPSEASITLRTEAPPRAGTEEAIEADPRLTPDLRVL